MRMSRRQFVIGSGTAVGISAGTTPGWPRPGLPTPHHPDAQSPAPERSDPWLEVEAAAIRHNVREVSRLSGRRPILAVVKNNAYGLGLATVGPVLDEMDEISGLAVVKTDQALALRDAGVTKPVLLMGLFADQDAEELVARDIELAPYTDGVDRTLAHLAARFDRNIPVQLYLDTGMGRLGMDFRRAPDWIASLAATPGVEVRGTFTALTEDDFDSVQLERLLEVAQEARNRGADPGLLHIASSHGLFFRSSAYLDMVRPGLVLYGAYPAGALASQQADLRPAFRLRARVVRVEQLQPGDGVSYGRNYVAELPTWTATLPVGHADGYPREAVNGCEVLIGDRTYRVIGAVSASHAVVEVGEEKTVEVGDVATLVGPDNASIHPNAVAERCGVSVYDVLMHLSARLPKRVV
jgi:alanine racemase